MDKPYQIVLDIWAGNPQIQPDVLRDNGVKGLIVRLNSISGTLHLDSQFTTNWSRAKLFDVQAIYFVYYPWATGQQNYDWLAAHLPADYGKQRVFVDVEAVRNGYSPAAYSAELKHFIGQAKANGVALSVYSGGGSLGILSPWPKDVDYWWAGYPSALDNCEDWDKYRAILETFDFASATRLCPGPARMWQCSGDSVDNMPGFGGHAVDVSVFPGTEEELRSWFGVEGENDMTDWTKNYALGYVAESPIWTTGIFQFIVGYAGGNWTRRASDGHMVLEPNGQLKAIETKARAEGLPLFMLWDFDVADYSNDQIDANDAKWPSPEADYPLQSLIHALEDRDFDGLIIRVMNRKGFGGKEMMMNYVSFAAHKFIERANEWLHQTKGAKKQTLVLTSDPFLRQSPDNAQEEFYSWLKPDFLPVAVEQATTALVGNAYPSSGDAPGAIGNNSWRMWYHWWSVKTPPVVDRNAGLMIYNGDVAALKAWLQIGTVAPPPPPPPVTDPDLAALTQAVDALTLRVVELERWRKS